MTLTVSELETHVKRSHVIQEPFSCSYCEFKTSDESNLKSHLVKEHEDYAIITVVGTQQIYLLEAMEALRQDMGIQMNKVVKSNTELRGEVSLLREEIPRPTHGQGKTVLERNV